MTIKKNITDKKQKQQQKKRQYSCSRCGVVGAGYPDHINGHQLVCGSCGGSDILIDSQTKQKVLWTVQE